jgi:mannose-1-phosphate guanylyltransferase/mannose-6-phosphate isomerase
LPKQFLALLGGESLLVETCRRVGDAELFFPPVVICNEDHRSVVRQQLQEAGITPLAVIGEPLARGTAAVAAVAAEYASRAEPGALVLLLSADSYFQSVDKFLTAVHRGVAAAIDDHIVVFGIRPSRPDSGFGYIKTSGDAGRTEGAQPVSSFVEKPDLVTAQRFVAEGTFLWNSGNFLFQPRILLREFDRLEPQILAACMSAMTGADLETGQVTLDADWLARGPVASFDRSILERAERVAVVEIDTGWSDVGTWEALWDVAVRDANGNFLSGNVADLDVHDSYVRSNGRLIAAIGLTDVVIVEHADALLVASRGRSSEIKTILERHKAPGASLRAALETASTQNSISGSGVNHVTIAIGGSYLGEVAAGLICHVILRQGAGGLTFSGIERNLTIESPVSVATGSSYRIENKGERPLSVVEIRVEAAGSDGTA